MGLLRVLLALAVLFEHTGGLGDERGGYWMIGGPLAVQAFFVISGFYMGLVLNERYDRPALNRAFYLNRAIRIYSIYFLFLALYLAVFALAQWQTGHSPLDPYFSSLVTWPEKLGLALLNLTVIGQDLPLWLRIEDGQLAWTTQAFGTGPLDVFHFMAIPVAWSLSLELCFYLIAPFIARRSWQQIAALFAASVMLRLSAAGLGFTADPFSYRFFPFELALFLAGVLAYKAWAANHQRWDGAGARALALAVPAATLAYPLLLGDWPETAFFTPPRILYLLLIACALPAVHQWSRNSVLDRQIGELSYPLYLNQLLVLGLLAGWPALGANASVRTVAVALVSLALAWVVVRFVDARIEAWRRRLAARAGAQQIGG
ncbi:acyltransferase [Novosphingobium sp.]|uniref:acyltransferase family protein n=1 Tax=Novosphingobium sp. TaxID=1874826 RepID=UPI0025DB4C43|nr:acyltransferase [Novosphingobium sp.]MCC6925970.1 acyltransferase [Novosphingobium sp.]